MDYIVCHHRRSWPTISTVVCEECKRMGKCADYQAYLNPSLFPGKTEADMTRQSIKRKKVKYEEEVNTDPVPEQLLLDLDSHQK